MIAVVFTDTINLGAVLTLALVIGAIVVSWKINSARSWKDLAESRGEKIDDIEKSLAKANIKIAELEGQVRSLASRTDVTLLVEALTVHEKAASGRHEKLLNTLIRAVNNPAHTKD